MKTWKIEIHFPPPLPVFTCIEEANSLSTAVSQAKRYARANGYLEEPIRVFAREVAA